MFSVIVAPLADPGSTDSSVSPPSPPLSSSSPIVPLPTLTVHPSTPPLLNSSSIVPSTPSPSPASPLPFPSRTNILYCPQCLPVTSLSLRLPSTTYLHLTIAPPVLPLEPRLVPPSTSSGSTPTLCNLVY